MIKTFKFKIYPTDRQKEMLEIHFGHNRFVWNEALDYIKNTENGLYPGWVIMFKRLPGLKEEKEWLKQAHSQTLQSTLRKLDIAYQCAIKGIRGFPKLKKKNKEVQSIEFPQKTFALFDKKLSKVPKLGEIKTKFHRKFFGQIRTCYITKSPANEYNIHYVVEDFIPQPKYKTEGVNLTGVDLGIKDLAITSTGKKYENNKFLKKKLHQLKKAQKVLSRRSLKKKKIVVVNKKMHGPFSKDEPLKEFTETVNVYSNRREKARLQVAKIHRDIKNCREDHLHKVSKQLVDENEGLVFETLNIKGMVKKPQISTSNL